MCENKSVFLSFKTLLLHRLAQSPDLMQSAVGFGLFGTETILPLTSVLNFTSMTLG